MIQGSFEFWPTPLKLYRLTEGLSDSWKLPSFSCFALWNLADDLWVLFLHDHWPSNSYQYECGPSGDILSSCIPSIRAVNVLSTPRLPDSRLWLPVDPCLLILFTRWTNTIFYLLLYCLKPESMETSFTTIS